jgi:hypothetical protein
VISDVYDSLVHLFKAYGCPAPIYLGEHWKDQHLPPLSVVIWQTNDVFAPQGASVTPLQRGMYINPRPVATRRCGLNAQLWATAPEQRDPCDQYRADLAWLDALVNQFVVGLQAIASGIHVVSGGVHAPGNAGSVRSGLGYDMTSMVDIPIVDAPWPAQQLDKCTTTWMYRPATAEITIAGNVDPNPPHYQPGIVFPVPTATE